MSRSGFTSGEIEALANADVKSLAKELLPHGLSDGHFWSCYNLDGLKSRSGNRSLKVNLTGPHIGLWKDFGGGDAGDMVKLTAIMRFGGADKDGFGKAYAWLKSRYGMDTLDPARIEAVKREIAEKARARDQEATRDAQGKRGFAQWLWHGAAVLGGTPAQQYLAGRGIDFARLGKLPGALRFRGDCTHRERAGTFPAMLAGIWQFDDPQLVAVHRTYLGVDAARVGKMTGVIDTKLTVGVYRGGCIPLWKGACAKPLRDIDAGTPVFVSEGIEDGLSWALANPSHRVVAAVAISNMGGLCLPPQAGPITFILQHDAPGSKAVIQIKTAMARQQAAGRTVHTVTPPPGFKDFNDLLTGKKMAEC